MATRMCAQPVVNDVDGIAGGRCVATERVASWVCARIVVNASTLSWVCVGTTQTRTGSGCRNVAFRSSTTRTMLALTARAAMRLLARVVVNDVDVFVHSAVAWLPSAGTWCGWPLASLRLVRWTVTGFVGGNELGEFQPQRSARVRCPYDLAGGLLDTTSSDQQSLRLRMFATRGPKGDFGASPPCTQSSRAGRLLTVQTREEPRAE